MVEVEELVSEDEEEPFSSKTVTKVAKATVNTLWVPAPTANIEEVEDELPLLSKAKGKRKDVRADKEVQDFMRRSL